jgi:hypothetical protein
LRTHEEKFVEAQKVAPSKKGATSKADMAVSFIKKLYTIEKKIKDLSPDKRLAIRQGEAIPQLEKLKSWLDKSLVTTLLKGKTGMALSYLATNWKKLSKRLAKDTSLLIPRLDKLIPIRLTESIYKKITLAMGRDH